MTTYNSRNRRYTKKQQQQIREWKIRVDALPYWIRAPLGILAIPFAALFYTAYTIWLISLIAWIWGWVLIGNIQNWWWWRRRSLINWMRSVVR